MLIHWPYDFLLVIYSNNVIVSFMQNFQVLEAGSFHENIFNVLTFKLEAT